MIGRQVPKEELEKILGEEAQRDEILEQVKTELREIKPGECLAYEAKQGLGAAQDLSLSLIIRSIPKVKLATKGDMSYVYREG